MILGYFQTGLFMTKNPENDEMGRLLIWIGAFPRSLRSTSKEKLEIVLDEIAFFDQKKKHPQVTGFETNAESSRDVHGKNDEPVTGEKKMVDHLILPRNVQPFCHEPGKLGPCWDRLPQGNFLRFSGTMKFTELLW